MFPSCRLTPTGSSPKEHDRETYRRRNEVERLFRRLKGCRRVFTRYDKLDVMFLAFIHLALVFVDTREPWPHPWAVYLPANAILELGTLETGDAALAALPDGTICERKTVSDFLAAVGRERKRFDLEVKRARYCGSFVIIVEGTYADVLTANHARGLLSEEAIAGSIATWTRRGAPVLFAGSPRLAAKLAYRFLAGQVREIERAAKAIGKAESAS